MRGAAIIAAAILIIGLYLMQGAKPQPGEVEVTEAYPDLSTNHVFTSISGQRAVEVLKSGDGVVFLGFPSCPWCQKLAPIVDEAARSKGISAVYYLDIQQARQQNDETYQKLVDLLRPYLPKDEKGEPIIYVPDVTVVKSGNIIGRFKMEAAEADVKTPAAYWTETRRDNALDQLRGFMSELPGSKI